jgi:hypothetical protein
VVDNQPNAPGQKEQTARIRQLAVWLLGAFASIGAVAVAGLSLTPLANADLERKHQVLAIAGLALALIAVGYAILQTLKVLTAGALSLNDLPGAGALATALEDNQTFMLGDIPSFQALANQYQQTDVARAAAYRAHLDNPLDGELRTAYDVAENRATAISNRAAVVLAFAENRAVRIELDRAKARIALAAFCTALGVVLFVIGSADTHAPSRVTALTRVSVDLTPAGLDAYRAAVGKTQKPKSSEKDQRAAGESCAAKLNPPLGTTAVSGRLDRPSVVIPRQGKNCPSVRLTISGDLGTIALPTDAPTPKATTPSPTQSVKIVVIVPATIPETR